MRVVTGIPGQGGASQVDSARVGLDTRVPQLAQRPQPPLITGSGAIADDGSRASVRPLQLRQKDQQPLQNQAIGSLAGHAATSVLLSLAKLESHHGWSQSPAGHQHASLEQEILELVSLPPRAAAPSRPAPSPPVATWPSPQANRPPKAFDSIVPGRQGSVTFGAPSPTNALPGAFEFPRDAPQVPTASDALPQAYLPSKELENPRPAPPVPAAIGAGYRPPAMDQASPPIRNKLRKDPPTPRPPQQESSISRLMNKIAPPVRNKLQKAPPPPKAPKQENSISRLMNKIAPPVRNKLRKEPPPSSSTSPIISNPVLQSDSLSHGMDADELRQWPESPVAQPTISHPVRQPDNLSFSADEEVDELAQRPETPIRNSRWSSSTESTIDDRKLGSRFLGRCTAQVKALLR